MADPSAMAPHTVDIGDKPAIDPITGSIPAFAPSDAAQPLAHASIERSRVRADDHREAAERLGHPLAVFLWYQLRDRSELDRRAVFLALQPRLDVQDTTEKQEIAKRALERYRTLKGSLPSPRTYDQFRKRQPDPTTWPSPSYIRRAFGSWPAAIAAVDGTRPLTDITARRLVTNGRRCDEQEVLAALRAWAAATPANQALGLDDFVSYCRAQMADPDSPFDRLPRSDGPIYRILGSWRSALKDLGYGHRLAGEFGRAMREAEALAADAGQLKSEAAQGARRDALALLSGVPQTTGHRLTDEELFAWLRWMGCRPGAGHCLSQNQVKRERARLMAAAAMVGLGLTVPGPDTYIHRFGWSEAKQRAGVK